MFGPTKRPDMKYLFSQTKIPLHMISRYADNDKMDVYTCTCTHTYTDRQTHTDRQTYTHVTHTYTYIHTHSQYTYIHTHSTHTHIAVFSQHQLAKHVGLADEHLIEQ